MIRYGWLVAGLILLEPLLWLNLKPTTADHHEWNAAVQEMRELLAKHRAPSDKETT